MNSRLYVFTLLVGVVSMPLSGCGLYRAAQIDKPVTPAVLRTASVVKTPPDLRVTPPLRSVVSTVTAPAVSGAPVHGGSAVTTTMPASAPQAATKEPEPEKALFAPYFPTINEKAPPTKWVVTPNYDFPWITGALPDRVNEENTFGVGAAMFGRLYAKVAFGTEVLPKPADPSSEVVGDDAQKHKSSSVFSRWFSSGNTKKIEPVVQRGAPKPANAASTVCAGATCLDAARDMLLADAQSKGWKMLLNRRVSLHQSFQFDRNGRVIWIEVDSDGKNGLKIEYAMLPMQSGK